METGKVIDRVVLSKYCKKCERRKGWDKEGEEYRQWWDGHKDKCSGQHKGRGGKMEVDAAGILWGRSIDKYKLRYKYMLCDGDSKAFNLVKEI